MSEHRRAPRRSVRAAVSAAAVVSENTIIIIIIDNTKIEMLAQSSCWAAQMSSLSR